MTGFAENKGDEISIHALRKESDTCLAHPLWRTTQFQSTLSVRRATRPTSDNPPTQTHFNPRSP